LSRSAVLSTIAIVKARQVSTARVHRQFRVSEIASRTHCLNLSPVDSAGSCSIAEVARLSLDHAENCILEITNPDPCVAAACDVKTVMASMFTFNASCLAYAVAACNAYVAMTPTCLANCTAGSAPSNAPAPPAAICGSSQQDFMNIAVEIGTGTVQIRRIETNCAGVLQAK
jgi:hypothetical protein